ncbi:MAG: sigma-70 family RNA polymerase sigma factor [Acidobacteriota bacterium]
MTNTDDHLTDRGDVTRLLKRWKAGEERAFEDLLPLVYEELRVVASAYLRRERAGHTMQTTDLVHEAYMRLSNAASIDAKDRSHFFAVAARAMRRILVDHARSQKADKRVGAHRRFALDDALGVGVPFDEQVILVHEALERLAASHPRPARLVELRFFGGLTEREAIEVLGASKSTLERDWRFAKLWLYRQLQQGADVTET